MADFWDAFLLFRINCGIYSTLSYFEYWVNPSHCAHLLPNEAGPAVTASSLILHPEQPGSSFTKYTLIVFIVAPCSHLHLHLYHSCGIFGQKNYDLFSFSCHYSSIWVSAKQSGEGTGWVSETLCSSSRRSDISCIPLGKSPDSWVFVYLFVTQS